MSPYLKLLPMLAGIGSPGTIQEVKWRAPRAEHVQPISISYIGFLIARVLCKSAKVLLHGARTPEW